MKYVFFFIGIISFFSSIAIKIPPKPITRTNSVDSIYVSKTERVLKLFAHSRLVKSYAISIGENPVGHKQQQGDNRTPEGLYYINGKNANSSYYKNLGISYPNANDIAKAKKRNVQPGGDIKIHGYADEHGSTKNKSVKYAYTWGCIGVTNNNMDEIFDWVKVGAKIYISK